MKFLSLQDKMKCLEKENQYLKSLLDRAGISYYASDEMKNRDLFDPDQGKRIIPREITDHDANLFFGKFLGTHGCICQTYPQKIYGRDQLLHAMLQFL